MSATFLKIEKALKNKGITLVETILYIVLLMIVTGIVVQMLIAIGGIYKSIKVTRELESSGTIVMESMLREIKNASSVNIGSSILGVNPGAITLSGVDENLNPYAIAFSVSSGAIRVSKNGGPAVPLTSSSGTISYLVFTRITSANSEGVRIVLEISGTLGSVSKSERFYGFASLRGSY